MLASQHPEKEHRPSEHLSDKQKSRQLWQRDYQHPELINEVHDDNPEQNRRQASVQESAQNGDCRNQRKAAQEGLNQARGLRIDERAGEDREDKRRGNRQSKDWQRPLEFWLLFGQLTHSVSHSLKSQSDDDQKRSMDDKRKRKSLAEGRCSSQLRSKRLGAPILPFLLQSCLEVPDRRAVSDKKIPQGLSL